MLETRVSVREGHNIFFNWIAPKFLQEFPDAVFLGLDEESLPGEVEDFSLETRVTVRKGHNFLSNLWAALKILQKFPDAVFL